MTPTPTPTTYMMTDTNARIVDAIHPFHVPNRGTVTLLQLEYHRNGVGGAGFWAAIVDYDDERRYLGTPARMLVTHFSDHDEFGFTAAYEIDMLHKPDEDGDVVGVMFGANSWRGADMFEHAMLTFIDERRYLDDMVVFEEKYVDDQLAIGAYAHKRRLAGDGEVN